MTEHERIRPTTDEVRAALEEQMSKSRFGRRALKSQEGMDRAMTMLESEIGGSDLTREADGTLRISTAGADWPTAIFATFFLGFASVLSPEPNVVVHPDHGLDHHHDRRLRGRQPHERDQCPERHESG